MSSAVQQRKTYSNVKIPIDTTSINEKTASFASDSDSTVLNAKDAVEKMTSAIMTFTVIEPYRPLPSNARAIVCLNVCGII